MDAFLFGYVNNEATDLATFFSIHQRIHLHPPMTTGYLPASHLPKHWTKISLETLIGREGGLE